MTIWPKFKDANWKREPSKDRRIVRGDPFAGDAWVNDAGEIRYCVVGHAPCHPMFDARTVTAA